MPRAVKAGLTLDRLRKEGQQFSEEISREYYVSGAGLKASADLQPIYEKHKQIMTPDALDLAREASLVDTLVAAEHARRHLRPHLVLGQRHVLDDGRAIDDVEITVRKGQLAVLAHEHGLETELFRAALDEVAVDVGDVDVPRRHRRAVEHGADVRAGLRTEVEDAGLAIQRERFAEQRRAPLAGASGRALNGADDGLHLRPIVDCPRCDIGFADTARSRSRHPTAARPLSN